MFFSPIARRSLAVRSLHGTCYLLLTMGAATILIPLLIMVAGSFSPSSSQKISLFPAYLLNDDSLWSGYLASKYNQSTTTLRAAWGDPSVDLESIRQPAGLNPVKIETWNKFLSEVEIEPLFQSGGFFGTSRLPQYNKRNFSSWLLAKYDGDLTRLNRELGTEFASTNTILPPVLSLTGAPFQSSPLMSQLLEFIRERMGQSERITMNAGGYYRGVFLPQVVGMSIKDFNAKYGTHHASFSDIPFSATVPSVAADTWFLFVSKILRPDFVRLTETGEKHFLESGLTRDEFIRRQSLPPDLKVHTLDVLFTEWAATRGLDATAIPQQDLDFYYFSAQKSRWRGVFLTQNYSVVLDEILVHGRAITNTLILVVLSVTGALIINPMAAYALSRYRPKFTYQIILFCLVTMALPAEVTMIPVFLQLKEFGLLNTFGALVIPGLANGFSIFLLKGFFDSLPRDLYDAADLDGAGEFTIFWQITMNLSRPILAVMALGAFTNAYGTFMYALILCPDPKMWTIMVYLFQLMQSVGSPILYAALIIVSIPTVLIFIFCQNIILKGIVVPSEK